MKNQDFNLANVRRVFHQFIRIQYPGENFSNFREVFKKEFDHTAVLTLKEVLCFLKHIYFDSLNLDEFEKAESVLKQYLVIRDSGMFKEFGDSFDIKNVLKAYSFLVKVRSLPVSSQDYKFVKAAVFLTHKEVLCFLESWYLEALRNDDYDEVKYLLRQYQLIHDNLIFRDLDTTGL